MRIAASLRLLPAHGPSRQKPSVTRNSAPCVAQSRMLPSAVEEAVGQKIERRAHMRAGILIGVQRAAPAHHEDQLQIRARAEAETAAAAFGYFLGAAEPPPAHAGTPAILQMRRHSSAATGTTESRDCRTSARSPSLGSALIDASVTGVFTGCSGRTSTMTKRPCSSPGSG